MTKTLAGRVALVTGASRGIGAAIARRLADDGADVAISYASSAEKAMSVVREIESKGVRAATFAADQADSEKVAAMVHAVAAEFGRIDILVNNAGVSGRGAVQDPLDTAAIDRVYAINLRGVVAAVRAAAPAIPAGGRIISIGSCLGARTLWPGLADYSATKAAVAALTRGWSRDLGPKGITVNVVQPGPIETDLNPDHGAFADSERAATALGRVGPPEDVAAAVAFLAGPGAGYITGAALSVDGGYGA